MSSFEVLAFQAARVAITTLVGQLTLHASARSWGWIEQKLDSRTEAAIAHAADKYLQNYRDRHGILKVLGMREPVPLEAVYTTVQFLDRLEIHWYESIETLERAYRRDRIRSFQPRTLNKQDGLQVANEKQFLMVLGGPGAGKSTFLRKIGLESLKRGHGGYGHECIPVLLDLKNFTGKDLNFETAIAQEFRICGFPEPEVITARLLEQGHLLILLDGLDEVPSKHLDDVIHHMQNFVDRYDKNRYIASCRIAAYRHNFRRFTDVAMAEFDNAQVQQFIRNWFRSEADLKANTAQRCWELLHKPEHASARELAHTPLLLTLLCLVYDRAQNFPNNRSALYRKAMRVLLEEWAAEKRILREEIYQGLNTELEEILLSEIAYAGFESDRLFFSARDITAQIREFLTNNLNAPKHLDSESVLNAIAIQQGILVERAEGIYSFSHLTLQEYLTAQYVEDNHQTAHLIARHLGSERWQEVFLLIAGLSRSGADDLLLRMERKARKYLNTPKLTALLAWADLITHNTRPTVPLAAKRAAALFLAVNSDRALEVVRVFSEDLARVLDLLRTLDLTRVSSNTIDLNRAVNLAKSLNPEGIPARANARNRALATTTTRTIAKAVTKSLSKNLEAYHLFENTSFTPLIARMEALKLKAPNANHPPEMIQAFHDRVSQTWFQFLKLDAACVDLTPAEARSLDVYLYVNWLMVRCKLAAVRVSPPAWQGIELRMLRSGK